MYTEKKFKLGALLVLAFSLILAGCGAEITKLTQEEAVAVMKAAPGFPKQRSMSIPAKVHERDWGVAYNRTGFLRKFVNAGLLEVVEPLSGEEVYVIQPTDEGVNYLLNDGVAEDGGDFGLGFYTAKLASENYSKVNRIGEMVRFRGPPPSIELQVTDVYFDITLSDVTPYGEVLGLKDGQTEEDKTGLLWKVDQWTYQTK